MWSVIEVPKLDSNQRAFVKHIKSKKEMLLSCFDIDQVLKATAYRDIERAVGSLAIEGTHVSEEDMTTICYDGVPRSIRKLNVLMEAVNMSKAIDTMYDFIYSGVGFSEEVLLKLHGIFSNNLLDLDNSGRYRNCMVSIGNGNYQVAQINQIRKLMKELFNQLELIDDPVVKATFFSYTMVCIHPFKDFNGRTSRLCEGYILLSNGYPVPTITPEERAHYIKLISSGSYGGVKFNWEYTKWIGEKVMDTIDSMLSCNPEY